MIRVNVPFSLDEYDALDQVGELPQKIKAWLLKVKSANEELQKTKDINVHHAYIETNKRLWGNVDLKDWLLKLSYDKCWYTEVKFGADYPEIEHFRPKKSAKNEKGDVVISSGYYWLAFNLTNYRLSKPMPNRKKGTFFPIADKSKRAHVCTDCHLDERPWFLDPLAPRDPLLLSFNDNGKAVPANRTTDFQQKRVQFTISRFGLNHSLLNRRRKVVWKTCRRLFANYCRLTAQAENSKSVRAETKAENVLKELLTLMKPSAEFSSVAKESLKKTGNAMAISIATSAA